MRLILFGVLTMLFSLAVQAEDEVKTLSNISGELVEIRQEIEALHGQINRQKELYGDKVRALSSQKTDLEVRIGRSDLNVKELQEELNRIRAKNAQEYESSEKIIPSLQAAIAELRRVVEADLPFKHSERLQALDEIESRLNTSTISPNKAANQLWAFVEDELMLGKTNGIYNDLVDVDGERKLVKVLRIGKVSSFYRSNDGQYGVIRKTGEDDWQSIPLTDNTSVRQLDQLFDSFSKNIRNGVFTVPNFLPKS